MVLWFEHLKLIEVMEINNLFSKLLILFRINISQNEKINIFIIGMPSYSILFYEERKTNISIAFQKVTSLIKMLI